MRFLMNDTDIITADSIEKAVVAYSDHEPVDVAIIGESKKYQLKMTVELVKDEPIKRSQFATQILKDLEATKEPVCLKFSAEETEELYALAKEGEIRVETTPSGSTRVYPAVYLSERSKFQTELLEELWNCNEMGRNFHVNNHADIEDLSRRKIITIKEREGNYFVIELHRQEGEFNSFQLKVIEMVRYLLSLTWQFKAGELQWLEELNEKDIINMGTIINYKGSGMYEVVLRKGAKYV